MSDTVAPAAIKVMSSAAVQEAYRILVPRFEAVSGRMVATEVVPTVEMARRLAAGETPDLAIMSQSGIDTLIRGGHFAAGSRTDIARSGIGVAVRQGAPRPNIATADALKHALLAADSVAYSTGPSGVYLATLFQRMGIAEALKPKLKVIFGAPVGQAVARGEAEIGFQQIPELMPVAGIDLIGPLPAEIQTITVFSAGRPVGARNVEGAQGLVAFLTSPEAAKVFQRTGMEPG